MILPVCILSLFLISGFSSFTEYIYGLFLVSFDRMTADSLIAYYFVLSFFLAVPVFMFLSGIFVSLNDKEKYYTLNELLSAREDYKTALIISSVYFAILLFVFAFPFVIKNVVQYSVKWLGISGNYFFEIVTKTLLIFVCLMVYIFILAFCSDFLLMYRIFLVKKMQFPELIKNSFLCMKNRKTDFIFLNISFLPMFFISYFLFPLLIFYFFPYYFITLDSFLKSCFEEHISA